MSHKTPSGRNLGPQQPPTLEGFNKRMPQDGSQRNRYNIIGERNSKMHALHWRAVRFTNEAGLTIDGPDNLWSALVVVGHDIVPTQKGAEGTSVAVAEEGHEGYVADTIPGLGEVAVLGRVERVGRSPDEIDGRPALPSILTSKFTGIDIATHGEIDADYQRRARLLNERFGQLVRAKGGLDVEGLEYVTTDITGRKIIALTKETTNYLRGTDPRSAQKIADVKAKTESLETYKENVLRQRLELCQQFRRACNSLDRSASFKDGVAALSGLAELRDAFDEMILATGLQQKWSNPMESSQSMRRTLEQMIILDRSRNKHISNFSQVLGHAEYYYANLWLVFSARINYMTKKTQPS